MVDTKTSVEGEQTTETSELTDGFHLVIDALKLNGINTIYNVPGIPITDLAFPPVLDMIALSRFPLMCHLSLDILRILRSLSDWICSLENG